MLNFFHSVQGGEEESVRILPSPADTGEGGVVRGSGANKGDVRGHAGEGEGGALVSPTETDVPQGHGAEGCDGCLGTCQVSDIERTFYLASRYRNICLYINFFLFNFSLHSPVSFLHVIIVLLVFTYISLNISTAKRLLFSSLPFFYLLPLSCILCCAWVLMPCCVCVQGGGGGHDTAREQHLRAWWTPSVCQRPPRLCPWADTEGAEGRYRIGYNFSDSAHIVSTQHL